MTWLASCCTFYLFHNHQTNNWNKLSLYLVYLTKQTQILRKKDPKVTIHQNCYICMNFQPFCSKENSETCTIEKGTQLSFMLLILLSFWNSPSLVSDKFVTIVQILLNKRHFIFSFYILDFTSYRVNFTN